MKTLCTISDKNYLNAGLALYDSVVKNSSEDFVLYYLCLDDEAYNIINGIGSTNIKPIHISELASDDFTMLKNNFGSSVAQYCWALGSFFTEYIVKTVGVEDIFYVDADIIFYEDIQKMYDAVNSKSIGVILHRHVPVGHSVGGYNVGVVYFKNDDIGYKCLKWWRDCVMNPKNEWFEKYGAVGDQVYLEGFAPLFGQENVSVLDNYIGHGAPWNFHLYIYLHESNEIVWAGRRQKIVFNHFSHFKPDFVNNTYKVDDHGEYWMLGNMHPRTRQYYNDYFETIKATKEKYKL